MGSLHKPQLTLLPHGKLYLPAALSLALLTGFTFSMITLSSALHGAALLPSMEFLFLVSLPHLWHASLSWVTPPCLFLLLNGIIMILTATSGTLSCKPSLSSSSELRPLLLPSVEKSARQDHGFESTTPTVTSTCRIAQPQTAANGVPDSGMDQSAGLQPDHTSVVSLLGSIGEPLNSIDHCAHTHTHTPDMIVAELAEHAIICDGGSEANNDDYIDDKKEMQTISQEEFREIADKDDVFGDNVDDYANLSAEESTDEFAKGASAPSTPKHSSSSPAWKDSMRRSFSIDSAPYMDDVEGSPEYSLSEEAFKKRIEDYICKVNAKLRSEIRYAPPL